MERENNPVVTKVPERCPACDSLLYGTNPTHTFGAYGCGSRLDLPSSHTVRLSDLPDLLQRTRTCYAHEVENLQELVDQTRRTNKHKTTVIRGLQAERDALRAEPDAEATNLLSLRRTYGARDRERTEDWLCRLHKGFMLAENGVETKKAEVPDPYAKFRKIPATNTEDAKGPITNPQARLCPRHEEHCRYRHHRCAYFKEVFTQPSGEGEGTVVCSFPESTTAAIAETNREDQ
jgi:hypothetical protein